MHDYVHAVLGGLQAPDPNRPFQSRPQTPAPPSIPAPASCPADPAAAPVHRQMPSSSQLAEPKQAGTSGSGAAVSKAFQGRAGPQSGRAKKQDNPQARVLAKLGLSKGQSGSNSSGGRSGTVALPQPPAGVSGESFPLPCSNWKNAFCYDAQCTVLEAWKVFRASCLVPASCASSPLLVSGLSKASSVESAHSAGGVMSAIAYSPNVTEHAMDYGTGFAAAFGSIAASQNTERTDTR